jgi:hypothetical protein
MMRLVPTARLIPVQGIALGKDFEPRPTRAEGPIYRFFSIL